MIVNLILIYCLPSVAVLREVKKCPDTAYVCAAGGAGWGEGKVCWAPRGQAASSRAVGYRVRAREWGCTWFFIIWIVTQLVQSLCRLTARKLEELLPQFHDFNAVEDKCCNSWVRRKWVI